MGFYQKLRIRIRAHRFLHKSEADECHFMLACLQNGMTAVDIGAHKAAYTYWMSRYVGKSGRVFAFEPVPTLAHYLQEYAKSCSRQNITVSPIAVSDETGPARLRIPRQDFMWSTLNFNPEEIDNPAEQCKYIPVQKDELDNQLNLHLDRRPVGFIKCDVEGHEYAVLLGAQKTLTVDQPVLLFESSRLDCVSVANNRAMSLLKNLGYEGYFFFNQELLAVAEYDARLHASSESDIQNFAFIHPERWTLVERRLPFAVIPKNARLKAAA